MKLLQRVARAAIVSLTPRALGIFLFACAFFLFPTSAHAAEGENVVLKFTQPQQIVLWCTCAIGIVSIIYGWGFLRRQVISQSPGNEAMQSVGLAIKEGALAYLQSQIRSMLPLVVVLALGLFGLYYRLGTTTASLVSLCFVLGVTGSYLAGYAGMLTAVLGNMRVANAALTSYKKSLEIAFRSGAVAGTVTVGIGLMGASLIILFAPKIATLLLVGFGFGGSLAALFMRVGGGIFTKAADVGADLVGKVEAGIPEDDPRNPAVIADNVGDNVGDCAGMAADVFESYEVTLIAAIVLAAATASIFDAQTWPRLIVFALAVSGIGLLGSMIGINMVKGSEDIDSDPLAAIRKGLHISAAVACFGTLALSYFLMGGTGPKVETAQVSSVLKRMEKEYLLFTKVQQDLAEEGKKSKDAVEAKDILADKRVLAAHFTKDDEPLVKQFLNAYKPEQFALAPDLSGYKQVTDFTDKSIPALQYAVQLPPDPNQPRQDKPKFATLGEFLSGKDKEANAFFKLRYKGKAPKQPGEAPTDVEGVMVIGPLTRASVDSQIEKQKNSVAPGTPPMDIKVESTYPIALYVSPDNELAFGLKDVDTEAVRIQPISSVGLYKKSVAELNAFVDQNNRNRTTPPEAVRVTVAIVDGKTVPWWGFWAVITFGIFMAYVIERLTDYFVSTNRKPTQEVAGVSTAGPAPMIIQGFAHAQVSSVCMTIAIVVALMFPLYLFSPAVYGGYMLSFYGIALVGIGLLTATGFVLAMDTFGPISDNAQGVFEMSGAGHTNPEGAKRVGRLDAAGNTTKALTKGFAIATAVVAAVALFHSYLDGANLNGIGLRVDIPEIFLGLMIGAAAPYLFSAFAINAVGRSSFELISEVRRQFHSDPGIMKGTSKPDYARCVAIVTKAAQKELLAPGILAIALPAAVGFGFSIGKPHIDIAGHTYNLTGAQALGGFLVGAIVSGQLLAVLMSNAGGMWDNAKKLIEDGMYGGKGSDAHKAAVVGDTIGDPFKDTAGPALNPLIKVMNLVAVLVSGVIIQPYSDGVLIAITLGLLGILALSMTVNRGQSMSAMLETAKAEGTGKPIEAAPQPIQNLEIPTPSAAPSKKKKLFIDESEEDSDPVGKS